ncbi:hypothetical protein QZH41_003628 [Actinostola sp. cb2023]|nr:hypothetical protein QZH41_003628 [Actinostola sp. cb2023]
MQDVLSALKKEHPEIKTAYIRQDNAGCYHSSGTILACPEIAKSTGIKIARIDFSDPQGGKGAADRLAATGKCHIRTYINEGNDVSTAEQMKDALLSSGGIEGVRVVSLETIDNPNISEHTPKIPAISKLNNFEFSNSSIRVWRAYGIGAGKEITIEQPSNDIDLPGGTLPSLYRFSRHNKMCKEWGFLLLEMFGRSLGTGDYGHLTVDHASMLLRMHRSFRELSNQGFEASHKLQRQVYAKCTSHDASDYVSSVKQMFLHMNAEKLLELRYAFREAKNSISSEDVVGRKKHGSWSDEEKEWILKMDNLFTDQFGPEFCKYTTTEKKTCVLVEKQFPVFKYVHSDWENASDKCSTTPQQSPTSNTTPQQSPTSNTTPQQSPTSNTTPQQSPTSNTTPQQSPTSNTTPQQSPTSNTTPQQSPTSNTTPQQSPTSNTTPQQSPTSNTTPQQSPTSNTTPQQSPTSNTTPQQSPTSNTNTLPYLLKCGLYTLPRGENLTLNLPRVVKKIIQDKWGPLTNDEEHMLYVVKTSVREFNPDQLEKFLHFVTGSPTAPLNPIRRISHSSRCAFTGGVRLREVPAYGRCPLTGGACLREVSAYGRCLLMGGVRLREVSAYGRCPLTGGVRLREVSAYGRCLLTGGVRLREVSAYGRCPLTGGVRLREVSAYGRCLLTGGVRLREVPAYGRCLLTGGDRLREVPAYGRCPLTGGVRLREVSAYGKCPLTGCVRLREVYAYGRCPLAGCVRLREVYAYERCPFKGGVRLREVPAYGRCSLTGGVR